MRIAHAGDSEARRRGVRKTVLERAAPPAFDVAIEMVERDSWRIHHNLAEAVDAILKGRKALGEIRTRSGSEDYTTEKGTRPAPKKIPLVVRKSTPFVMNIRSAVSCSHARDLLRSDHRQAHHTESTSREGSIQTACSRQATVRRRPVVVSERRVGGFDANCLPTACLHQISASSRIRVRSRTGAFLRKRGR